MKIPEGVFKPEITSGSWVVIDLEQPEAGEKLKELLREWDESYIWPMKVLRRTTPEHAVLMDKNGEIVYFGSTASASFHVGHIKLV